VTFRGPERPAQRTSWTPRLAGKVASFDTGGLVTSSIAVRDRLKELPAGAARRLAKRVSMTGRIKQERLGNISLMHDLTDALLGIRRRRMPLRQCCA